MRKKIIIVIGVMLMSIFMFGCSNSPKNVSDEIYTGSVKWVSYFEALKESGKSAEDKNTLEWAEFCNNNGKEETPEERLVLDSLTSIGITYASETTGEKDSNIKNTYDYKVAELKKTLKIK